MKFYYLLFLLLSSLTLISSYNYLRAYFDTVSSPYTNEKLTIRVNTFRRNDLLLIFLEHYIKCDCVKEIQVVWSDPLNNPVDFTSQITDELKSFYSNYSNKQINNKIDKLLKKIVYEKHSYNSLSNRFIPLIDISTDGIFSVDDDIIIHCHDLSFLLHTWTSNKK